MSTGQTKKILLTGANGYLGSTIRKTLSEKGYLIQTLGRSRESNYQVDLSVEVPVIQETFDYVVHNAGKAHIVPKSEEQAKDFFKVNVKGTANLLEGLSGNLPESIVFISSIAVYGLTTGININETAPLDAIDPYGKSKIEAEKLIENWAISKNIRYASLRLPLVAGKNPPGNLGALISGIQHGRYFQIGHSKARKSIVMAEDVASILPVAAQKGGIYNLTDGHHPSFYELEQTVTQQLQKDMPRNLPLGVAQVLGFAGDALDKIFVGRAPITSGKVKKITSTLTFDDTKARTMLGWKPNRVIDVFRIC